METVWYKSKTIIYGMLHLVALIMLKMFGIDLTDVVDKLGDNAIEMIAIMESMVIMVLRAVTNKPLKLPGKSGLLMLIIPVVLLMAIGGCSRVNLSEGTNIAGGDIAANIQTTRKAVAAGTMTDLQAADVIEDAADWFASLRGPGSMLSPQFAQHSVTHENIARQKAKILRGGAAIPGYSIVALDGTARAVALFRRADAGIPSQ